jgi:antitoxin FitA
VAQLVVRNLEESIKARLRRRAARHGHSMEEEVRDVLRDALRKEDEPPTGLGTRMARRFAGKGLDFDIPELRGEFVKPAALEE